MPKVIENLKEKLLDEASRQIREVGYEVMTIQSVARACGVGVGTVYNYFISKDDILHQYIGRDWVECVKVIDAVSKYSDSYDSVIRCIYDQVLAFGEQHKAVFTNESAAAVVDGLLYRWMGIIAREVARPLRKFCKSDAEAQIIAEALLTWIRTGKSFTEVHDNIVKLF